MARLTMFLIAVALIAGIAACAAAQYNLTVSSTQGGHVASPGEGTFSYDAGTVVDLTAEPDGGYYFVNWTGDVSTVGNANDAATIITIEDACSVTANFLAEVYNLTISSTGGGSVITPGLETSSYDGGTVVNLLATPHPGYRFVNWTGDVGTIADVNDASTTITMNAHYSITANFAQIALVVAAGWYHTVGVKSDGTVVAVGRNGEGQCNVGSWTDVVQVAAGFEHTVGVKSDGTVVAVGRNREGQCNVGGWTDIVQVAARGDHTVGLKSDGTVVATGENRYGQGNVGNWTDIIQVAAGYYHTVGIKSDGTVVAVGRNRYGECNVGNWTDVIQIAAGPGYSHTVGVETNGTVVAVGQNSEGQCDVGGWTDITQVAAGALHTAGLESDGTVVAVGYNGDRQCHVGGWHLT